MNKETFSIQDLYLAAYLKYKGFEICDLEKNNVGMSFVFIDKPERKEVMISYVNGKDNVIVKDFINILKDLKTLVKI